MSFIRRRPNVESTVYLMLLIVPLLICYWPHISRNEDRSNTASLGNLVIGVIYKKVNVKWSRYRPGVAQRVGRGIALLFHDRGTRRGWVVNSTPRPHFTPRERPGTHFTGGWEGPRAGSGRAENLVPTEIRSRTIQPVVSHYTVWDTICVIYISVKSSHIYIYIKQ